LGSLSEAAAEESTTAQDPARDIVASARAADSFARSRGAKPRSITALS
jgi:hypothetical protein